MELKTVKQELSASKAVAEELQEERDRAEEERSYAEMQARTLTLNA